ncbi:MAG: FtsX-like permease family protein [Leptospiraceae bacterium]|nr:FtsX-like permease family protein [Leptospiraceae bacterium]
MLGIFIGCMGYILISSMILGVQKFLMNQVIENDSHLRVKAKEEMIQSSEIKEELYSESEYIRWAIPPRGEKGSNSISHPVAWFEKLDHDPRITAYMPNLTSQVILRKNNKAVASVLIGTDPFKQIKITSIQENMEKGKFTDMGKSGNRIVVGDGLLKKLGASLNDYILVSGVKGQAEPFRIVAIFHLGLPQIDESVAYAPLSAVQKLNRTPSKISEIAIRLIDPNLSKEIAEEWSEYSKDQIQTWQEKNEQFLSAFKVQDFMRYMVTGAILIVAGFGIYNILTIVINQKKKEIAILKSIGFDSAEIMKLFLIQGLIMGVGGGLLGLLAGFIFTSYLSTLKIYPENFAMKGKIPFAFDFSIYVTGFLLAVFASMIASIFPAWQASKLTPIEIIRSES